MQASNFIALHVQQIFNTYHTTDKKHYYKVAIISGVLSAKNQQLRYSAAIRC